MSAAPQWSDLRHAEDATVKRLVEAGPVVWDADQDGPSAVVRAVEVDWDGRTVRIEWVNFVDRRGRIREGERQERWCFWAIDEWLEDEPLTPPAWAGYRLVRTVRDAETGDLRTTRRRPGKLYASADAVRGKKGLIKSMPARRDPWAGCSLSAEHEYGEVWPSLEEVSS